MPLLAHPDSGSAATLRSLREAALTDPDGPALDRAFAAADLSHEGRAKAAE